MTIVNDIFAPDFIISVSYHLITCIVLYCFSEKVGEKGTGVPVES